MKPLALNPSCLQATLAVWIEILYNNNAIPHTPSTHISSRPSTIVGPPIKRTEPLTHSLSSVD